MADNYTRAEIQQMCSNALQEVNTFYQQPFVNYTGKTSDTKEWYTEVVAEFVCNHISVFQSIRPITRQSSYHVGTHDGAYNPKSNRIEEITAMQMFWFCKHGGRYPFLGEIIDYQTPLKNTKEDVAGKIDLLAYDGDTLRLLELKKQDSKETMLRCVLEGYTYLRTADHAKLVDNFDKPDGTPVKASPFVYLGGAQWQEMQEDRPHLKKLMGLMDSVPYYITPMTVTMG